MAGILCVQALWVIPAQMDATQAARMERLDREERARKDGVEAGVHEHQAREARKWATIRMADQIQRQEEAIRLAEENARLARELNKQLRAAQTKGD